MVGHVAPEAMLGGPIGLVEEGDMISIDVNTRKITLEVPDAELAERRARWKAPTPHYKSGVMAKYASHVSQANDGAATILKL
jgi:dihydroxy-acid dehydratase